MLGGLLGQGRVGCLSLQGLLGVGSTNPRMASWLDPLSTKQRGLIQSSCQNPDLTLRGAQ